MVYSPVGIKCRSCARLPRSALVTLGGRRGLKAVVTGLAAGTALGFGYYLLLGILNFLFLSLVLAAGVGVVIGEAVFRASGAYRGRATAFVAAGCTVWAFVVPLLVSMGASLGLSWRTVALSLTARGVLQWVVVAVGAYFAWRRNR